MQRLQNAVCEGMKGGFIAFIVTFVIGALLAVGVAHSGGTVHGVAATGSPASVGGVVGGSFFALFFVIMFVGGLVQRPKPAVK